MSDRFQAQSPGTDDRLTERIFMRSGIIWQLCNRSYWMLLFTRVVVDLELSAAQLLLLGTVKEVTILLAEIPTGVVADLRSRKTSVILGFGCAGTGIVLAGIGTTFVVVALGQVFWSLGSTFRSGAETAWVTDELGSAEAVEPLLIRRARLGLLGVVAGVALSAAVAKASSLGVALVLVGAILISWGVVLMATMPETGFTPLQGPGSPLQRFIKVLRVGAQTTRNIGALRRLFIVVAMAGFASEAVDRLYVARFEELPESFVSIDATLVGGITIVQALIGAGALLLLKNRLQGSSLVPWLAVLHAGTAVGALLLSKGNLLLVAAIGVMTTGTLRAVAQPVVEAWTNNFAEPEHRATTHSFLGQAQSMGEISGGIGLGVVATAFDISTALLVSCAVYAVASALTALARRSSWNQAR